MIAAALLTLTLGSAPANIALPDVSESICSPVPPAPTRLELTRIDASTNDFWGAEATYALSSGDVGRMSFVIDRDGNGEAMLAVNGDVIAHVAIAEDPASGQLVTTTWWPPSVDYPPELIAELLRVDLPIVVLDSLPQEFKCSGFGRKALKAGRYLWAASIRVGTVLCCAGTGGLTPGCAVCVGASALVDTYISDKLENHCD